MKLRSHLDIALVIPQRELSRAISTCALTFCKPALSASYFRLIFVNHHTVDYAGVIIDMNASARFD
jgi:hypothetical protein